MKNTRQPLLLLVLLAVLGKAHAQHELTMPFMQDIFQCSYANPTHLPDHDASFSVAPLSGFYFNYQNTGFSINDLIENDTIYLRELPDNVSENNYTYIGTTYEWMSARVKIKDIYWSFNITDNFRARLAYPRSFLRLAVEGNASRIDMESGRYHSGG